jgi:hypothetical protein
LPKYRAQLLNPIGGVGDTDEFVIEPDAEAMTVAKA